MKRLILSALVAAASLVAIASNCEARGCRGGCHGSHGGGGFCAPQGCCGPAYGPSFVGQVYVEIATGVLVQAGGFQGGCFPGGASFHGGGISCGPRGCR